jgi:hypothetical protein
LHGAKSAPERHFKACNWICFIQIKHVLLETLSNPKQYKCYKSHSISFFTRRISSRNFPKNLNPYLIILMELFNMVKHVLCRYVQVASRRNCNCSRLRMMPSYSKAFITTTIACLMAVGFNGLWFNHCTKTYWKSLCWIISRSMVRTWVADLQKLNFLYSVRGSYNFNNLISVMHAHGVLSSKR